MEKISEVTERLMKMDRLIKEGKTGNAKEFASKLGVSKSQLYNHLEELKGMNVDIRYNKQRSTYEYFGDFELKVQRPLLVVRKNDLSETNGGYFCLSPGSQDSDGLNLNDLTKHLSC